MARTYFGASFGVAGGRRAQYTPPPPKPTPQPKYYVPGTGTGRTYTHASAIALQNADMARLYQNPSYTGPLQGPHNYEARVNANYARALYGLINRFIAQPVQNPYVAKYQAQLRQQHPFTSTQMPDRVVQVPRYNTPVTYSTPVNLGPTYDQFGNLISSGRSPTMLPDSYYNMQRRQAENFGNTGRILGDTLQGQGNRIMDQWTSVPTTAAREGGKSKAGTLADYGHNRGVYNNGGGGYDYGGGWDYGGGGGGGYSNAPDWYQNMVNWRYG